MTPEFADADLIGRLERTLVEWMPEFQSDLAWLVALDRGSEHKAGVDAAADWMLGKLRDLGCETATYPSDDYGMAVAGSLKGRGQGRALLVAHLDTVWPAETAAGWPLRIEGARAMGPGVVDNASGSLAGFYALKALQATGYDDFAEVTLLCNGDEEVGSPFSKEVIRGLAQGRDAAFILEAPSNPDEIISQRAGLMYYDLRVSGKNAHAGVEPEKGHNAIEELCLKLNACREIGGESEVLTVSVSTIEGGRRPNIVPDYARAEIDVRVETVEEAELVDAHFRAVAERVWVAGTLATLHGGMSHPPMERGPQSPRLVETAQSIGRLLGVELKDTFCGGTSDGCYSAVAGTPTLCGLAPYGALYHTRDEYLDLSTVVPRTALIAGLAASCGQRSD